jgi:hypothetical protein
MGMENLANFVGVLSVCGEVISFYEKPIGLYRIRWDATRFSQPAHAVAPKINQK